jgi:hypothetical protein
VLKLVCNDTGEHTQGKNSDKTDEAFVFSNEVVLQVVPP